MKFAFITFYFVLLGLLSLYGIYLYWIIALYFRRGEDNSPTNGSVGRSSFPFVTVQLPIFNEKMVALRLIEAVRAFDWPSDLLEIQVLDDSTDMTSTIIEEYLRQHQTHPVAVRHIRRSKRTGFKAGALANGLTLARGEFVAVFDADNLPRRDFLSATMPHFNKSNIGMVQTRWSFLNREESFLCRAQALFLDAHFHVEQQARFKGNLLFNFNGTAGIWRRRAIDDAGGWRSDTLTEDLDLSLRSQLAGWKFVYRDDYDVPTELPNSIVGFKLQQYRWSKGAVQTARKLLPTIMRSQLPFRMKIAAGFHLTHKFLNLILLLLSISLVPALYFRFESGATKLFLIDLPLFIIGTGSMTLYYWLATRNQKKPRDWKDRLTIPMLTSIGVALAVNNTRALISALVGRQTPFKRTPKSGSTGRKFLALPHDYKTPPDVSTFVELALALYAISAIAAAFSLDLLMTIPFLLTFAAGFGYFGTQGLRAWHDR